MSSPRRTSPEPEALQIDKPLAAERLLDALDCVYDLYQRLTGLADAKLAHLRAADTTALHRGAAEETGILRALRDGSAEQPAILADLAQCMRAVGPPGARLTELAAALPEPYASRLTAKTQGLQRIAAILQEKNRLAAAVAQGLHTHVRSVFAAVAKAGQEQVGYARDGRIQHESRNALLDAVG